MQISQRSGFKVAAETLPEDSENLHRENRKNGKCITAKQKKKPLLKANTNVATPENHVLPSVHAKNVALNFTFTPQEEEGISQQAPLKSLSA